MIKNNTNLPPTDHTTCFSKQILKCQNCQPMCTSEMEKRCPMSAFLWISLHFKFLVTPCFLSWHDTLTKYDTNWAISNHHNMTNCKTQHTIKIILQIMLKYETPPCLKHQDCKLTCTSEMEKHWPTSTFLFDSWHFHSLSCVLSWHYTLTKCAWKCATSEHHNIGQ